MKKLGQLLLDFGWIETPQLQQALQTQRVVGGRIGSCLLETGALDEAMLLRALAHQRSVPAARNIDLLNVPKEVLSFIPERVALRCLAIPFRMLGSELYVALLDVTNLDLHDEIAFATGKQVRIHIGNEVRIYTALHRYYGRELSDRFRLLETQLDKPPVAIPKRSSFGRHINRINDRPLPRVPEHMSTGTALAGGFLADGGRADKLNDRWDGGVRNAEAQTEGLQLGNGPPDADTLDLPPVATKEASVSPATTAPFLRRFDTLEKFSTALDQMDDREAMARLFAEHIRPHFRRLLLFKVLPEAAVGWLATGDGVDLGRLQASTIDIDQPSIFHDLDRGRALHQGPLASLKAHQDIVASFGPEPPEVCLFAPVRLGARLVSVVVGELAPDQDSAISRGEVLEACSALGRAFGNYILRHRSDSPATVTRPES